MYAQWISIWQCFALAFSPTSRLFGILEKQGEFFIVSIILFLSKITSIYIWGGISLAPILTQLCCME